MFDDDPDGPTDEDYRLMAADLSELVPPSYSLEELADMAQQAGYVEPATPW